MTAAWWFMLVVDVALVIWLYRSVKREDDALEAGEPQQAELEEEMEAFNARRTPTVKENAFLQNARKAESLGFLDGDDAA